MASRVDEAGGGGEGEGRAEGGAVSKKAALAPALPAGGQPRALDRLQSVFRELSLHSLCSDKMFEHRLGRSQRLEHPLGLRLLLPLLAHLGAAPVPARAHAARAWAHPGVLVSAPQLAFVRAALAAGEQPFAAAFAKAAGSAFSNLSWAPQGPPASGVIECGGYSRPDHGCSAEASDAVAAYTHALLFALGAGADGGAAHARAAARIMDAYARVTKYNISNAPLQAAWSASKWSRAAELVLRAEGGGEAVWPAANAAAFVAFLVNVELPLIANETNANGNWATSMIEGIAGIAVLTEDEELLQRAAFFWRTRVPSYVYMASDGPRPVPLPVRPGGQGPPNTQGWYGQETFNASVEGLAQETCRDAEHTQMGLAAALNAAETARIQGVDLFSEEAPRLRAGLEWHSRLLLGAAQPAFVCGGGRVVDANVSYPTFEVGFNALANRLGLPMPDTLAHLERNVRTLPLPENGWMMEWETLTHGGGPTL